MILQSAMSPRTRRRSRSAPARPLSLGARLRRLRLERGLTMKEVARRAALTESFISQLERDRVNPSVASLQRLTAALGTPLGRLFDEAAPPEGRGGRPGAAGPPALPRSPRHRLPALPRPQRQAGDDLGRGRTRRRQRRPALRTRRR